MLAWAYWFGWYFGDPETNEYLRAIRVWHGCTLWHVLPATGGIKMRGLLRDLPGPR